MIPEPMTIAKRSAEPSASAASLRPRLNGSMGGSRLASNIFAADVANLIPLHRIASARFLD
jgi:hypothetical protein